MANDDTENSQSAALGRKNSMMTFLRLRSQLLVKLLSEFATASASFGDSDSLLPSWIADNLKDL